MNNTEKKIPASWLIPFRIICYICGSYFFLMGFFLILFPQMAIKNSGVSHPMISGILRGTGGAVIFSTVWYIIIAQKPLENRIIATVIACANIFAIILDITSVALGEYTLSHAMLDIPIELLSFSTIVIFYYAVHQSSRELT
jgi:hypothetical protein